MLYTFAFYLAKNVNRVKIDPGCADVWVFITMLMRVKSLCQGYLCFTYVRCLTLFRLVLIYSCTTMFSLLTRSLRFTNNCHRIFVGLKYVEMPYFLNTHLICSEKPLIYGMTTGICSNLRRCEHANYCVIGTKPFLADHFDENYIGHYSTYCHKKNHKES